MSVVTQFQTAGLLRRFAAIGYDSLALFAVLLVAAIPLTVLPDTLRTQFWPMLVIRLYLLSVSFLFFGWSWVHGGQTLGMRAWRLRVIQVDGNTVSWRNALIRFLAAIVSWACGGLGFLWAWVDRRGQTWHDYLSGTRLIVVPKTRQ